jgi:NRPS condensation-like uncharacterized protein
MTQEKVEAGGTLSPNFSIVVRVRGEFSFHQLQEALDCVRARHRLLIPGAAEDPASRHFHLRSLSDDREDAWKEIVKEELRTPFAEEDGPFARFLWLRSLERSDLIGTFHHGVCDGFSGVYMLRDLLQALGNPTLQVAALPLPPHLASFIPEAVTANPRVKRQLRRNKMILRAIMLFGRLRERVLSQPRPVPAQGSESALGELPSNLRMCILTHTLTASQTDRLAQRCKAEGVTVHAAVCTAWLRAHAHTLPGSASRNRSVSSPVSLRNRLAQPVDETAGMFMSTVETRLRCTPGRDFWEMAREFHARFKQDAADENAFMMPLMFGAFSKDEIMAAAKAFFSRPVNYDFSITNLGRLNFPTEFGNLQVEAFYNLVNSSEHERTVGVNTVGGRMTFILIFREAKMTPQAGEQLMADALQQLAEASGW